MNKSVKNLVLSSLNLIIKLAIIIIGVVLISKGAVKAYNYGYSIFEDEPFQKAPSKTVSVTIPSGAGGESIGKLLEEKGLIGDATLFRIQYFASTYKDEIIPGTYELNSSMSATEMMAIMAHDTGEGVPGEEVPVEEPVGEE